METAGEMGNYETDGGNGKAFVHYEEGVMSSTHHVSSRRGLVSTQKPVSLFGPEVGCSLMHVCIR